MLEQFMLFLWRRRALVIGNFLVVGLAAWAYVFFVVKKEYQAQTTFLPPVSEQSSPLSIVGIPIPSLTGSPILTEQIETIFGSKALRRSVIEQFGFYRIFKLEKSKNKFELAARRLNKYLAMGCSEKGGMGFEKIISYTITCYHQSPVTAREMCEFAFAQLDSSVKDISMGRARRNRIFVEQQLGIHQREMDSLNAVYEKFQVDNKAFVVPEQLRLSLKSYAELKSAVLMNELKIKALRQEFHDNVPELRELEKSNRVYRQKLYEMETSGSPDVVPSLGFSVKLLPQYENILREREIQNQVILLLSKELEQARLQESKNVSPLVVVDPPYVPEYKARPKRLLLLALIMGIEHLFLLLLFAYQFYFSAVFLKHERVRSLLRAMKNGP